MIAWLEPNVASEVLTQKVNIFIFGVYCWHFLSTFHYVEFALLWGRLKPRWAMVPYLGARYSLLACTVGFQLGLCGPANETLWFIGCIAVIFASETLLLRAMTLWRSNMAVITFLAAIGIGHWVVGIVVYFVPLIHAWSEFRSTCEVVTQPGGPLPVFAYTMFFDLAILISTVLALARIGEARSSPLWSRLYKQGFFYFMVSFAVNLVTLIASSAAPDGSIGAIFSATGVVLSVMASSRAFISLLKMQNTQSVSGVLPELTTTNPLAQTLTNVHFSLSVLRDSCEVIQGGFSRNSISTRISPLPPPAVEESWIEAVMEGTDDRSFRSQV